MTEIAILILLVFTVIAAIFTIFVKDLLSAVISLASVGFAMAILFIFMQMPEIVTSQIVVEIICFALMLITLFKTSKLDATKQYSIKEVSPAIGMLFFIILFLIFSINALKSLPAFGEPIMKVSNEYIKKIIADIGVTNISTAILLDFRGYNTLIEALTIVAMSVCVAVILRKKGKKHE
jgi:multisubunit Na+/H+ antiporter MnhB subunit